MKKILLLPALLLTACATTTPVAPVPASPAASQTADIDAKVEVLRGTLK